MRRALSALLAVVAAAVAVAGCGDSGSSNTVPSKAEYKQTYASLNSEINALGLAVGNAINKSNGKSNKAIAKEFNDLADRTRAAAKKIDDATPPADANIQKQQAALVAGLNTAADDLDAISKASAKKDFKAAGTAAGKLDAGQRRRGEPARAAEQDRARDRPRPGEDDHEARDDHDGPVAGPDGTSR